jgi:subtilase family serine protease
MNRNNPRTSRLSLLTLPIYCILVSLGVSSCQKKAPLGHYDLVAASVTTKTSPIRVGDKVVFDYTVRNDGKDTVPGGTYNVDFHVDGKLVSFDHGTSDKGSGQKSDYSKAPGYFHIQPSRPGKYRYRLTVDEKNNLAEINETNNTLEGDIDVIP